MCGATYAHGMDENERARDAQDPEAPGDRRAVGPGNRRVRFLTVALLAAVVVIVVYVVIATVVLQ